MTIHHGRASPGTPCRRFLTALQAAHSPKLDFRQTGLVFHLPITEKCGTLKKIIVSMVDFPSFPNSTKITK